MGSKSNGVICATIKTPTQFVNVVTLTALPEMMHKKMVFIHKIVISLKRDKQLLTTQAKWIDFTGNNPCAWSIDKFSNGKSH